MLQQAVRLLGAATALRETTGNPMPLAERIRYQRTMATLGATLGEPVFAAAWKEGWGLSVEQAVTSALS